MRRKFTWKDIAGLSRYGPVSVFLYAVIIGTSTHLLSMILFPEVHFLFIILYLTILFSALSLVITIFWSSLFLHLSSGKDFELKKTYKHVSRYSWTFLLIPVIDRMFGTEYSIILSLDKLISLRVGVSGLVLWILVMALDTGVSVHRMQGHKKGKGIYPLLSILFTFMSLHLLFAQSPFILHYQRGSAYNQFLHLLFLLLIIEALLISLLLFLQAYRKRSTALLKNIKPFRTFHFSFLVFIGAIVAYELEPSISLDLTEILHLPFVMIPMLSMALTWQFTAMINDVYDRKIDELAHPDRPLVTGELSVETYSELAWSCAFVALFLSLLMGFPIFLLNLGFVIAGLAYSIPPVRLKDRPFGTVCVGYASMISFLVGIYSPTEWSYGIYAYRTVTKHIPIYPEVLSISMMIFILLSISPLINAIHDYEGDKKSGVRNVYTIYGKETGKKIVSVLTFFLFVAPMMILHTPIDIAIFTATGVFSSLIFYRYEDHRAIFGIYFLILIYALLRFTGII